eukprot:4427930-Amphidinium_carterae.2
MITQAGTERPARSAPPLAGALRATTARKKRGGSLHAPCAAKCAPTRAQRAHASTTKTCFEHTNCITKRADEKQGPTRIK